MQAVPQDNWVAFDLEYATMLHPNTFERFFSVSPIYRKIGIDQTLEIVDAAFRTVKKKWEDK